MAEDVAFLLHFTDAKAWKRSDKMALVPELNLSQCLRTISFLRWGMYKQKELDEWVLYLALKS